MTMKKHIPLIAITTIIVIFVGIFNFSYFQPRYKRDRAYEAYVQEKTSFENELKTINDSIFEIKKSEFMLAGDTAYRKIVKINKHARYSERGYYKKTGAFICINKEIDWRMVQYCTPESLFVPTDWVFSHYEYDTTWSGGYANHYEVVKAAEMYAKGFLKDYKFKEFEEPNTFFRYKKTSEWLGWIFFVDFMVPFLLLFIISKYVEQGENNQVKTEQVGNDKIKKKENGKIKKLLNDSDGLLYDVCMFVIGGNHHGAYICDIQRNFHMSYKQVMTVVRKLERMRLITVDDVYIHTHLDEEILKNFVYSCTFENLSAMADRETSQQPSTANDIPDDDKHPKCSQ